MAFEKKCGGKGGKGGKAVKVAAANLNDIYATNMMFPT